MYILDHLKLNRIAKENKIKTHFAAVLNNPLCINAQNYTENKHVQMKFFTTSNKRISDEME